MNQAGTGLINWATENDRMKQAVVRSPSSILFDQRRARGRIAGVHLADV